MTEDLVTFFAGGAEYGVSVERVHEVVRLDAVTRVPAAPPHVRGLTTHRGRMIPVLDLSMMLGARAPTHGAQARLVTVSAGARLVGLLVDRTAAVVSVPGPAAGPEGPRPAGLVTRTAEWQGRPVQVLDVDRLLEGPS
jgi:purine-binding chemotaxis protein CheW